MAGGYCRDDFTENRRGYSGDVPMDANARVSVDLRVIDVGRIVSSLVGELSVYPAIFFLEETDAF